MLTGNTLLKIFKGTLGVFAIDHITNALIVQLIARVRLIRQNHVRAVISLVTDQG